MIGPSGIGSGLGCVRKRRAKIGSRFLRCLWYVLFCSISGTHSFAASTDSDDAYGRDVEEVRVSAVAQCGSWPIAHVDIVGCEYAELKTEVLKDIRKHRADYLTRCLQCKDGTCALKTWSRDQMTARNLCKRLYITPIKVPSRSGRTDVSEASLLVRFSFSITHRGRVEDIHLDLLDSDLTESQVFKMIKRGARQVRFEPLKVDGQALSIEGLRDGYTLTGTF
ncbi:MAG TPA: hypothetical protein EYM33_10315 [Pseudomonadales bacterium]|nr:hypothetical protein [Pseudomonadales bacterium]